MASGWRPWHGSARPGSCACAFGRMFEVFQPRAARTDPAGEMLESRLERSCVSTHGWLLLSLEARAWVGGHRLQLYRDWASDLTPVMDRLSP